MNATKAQRHKGTKLREENIIYAVQKVLAVHSEVVLCVLNLANYLIPLHSCTLCACLPKSNVGR